MDTFRGKWITRPPFDTLEPIKMYHREEEKTDPASGHPEELRNLHTLFVRSFTVKKKGAKYLLKITSDDYGKYYINGQFVGQGPAPCYVESYNYNEFDVTPFIREGENGIAVHNYYQGLINRVWMSGDLRCGVIADLICDGEVILSTDAEWKYREIKGFATEGTVGYETQYLEHFDSRIKDGELLPVRVRGDMGVAFAEKPLPAVEVYEVKPEIAEKLKNGVFCDFGKEYCGGLKIKARGRSGSKVRILCGEELSDSEERVRFDMRCNCRYEEIWTLDGECEYENYDYKAFRYCSVIAEDEDTVIEDVTLVARNGRFDDSASSVTGENHVLGEVFDICKRGVKIGAQEAFMDCPSREKGQYTGDATVTSASHIWLTGSTAMLEKAIKDEAMSAKLIDDGIMATVCGSFMQEIADYSLQFPIHLLRHYSFTKDKAFLASMLPVAEKMVKHFSVYEREDGLLDGVVDKWNLVDWPANLRDGYDFPLTKPIGKGVHNVINAFWVGCVRNVEEIKDILGIPYEKRGDRLAEAFNRTFFRPEKGLYADSETSEHCSLPSNVIPCYYGFRPEGYEKPLGDFLISRGLVCGVYMAYFLLKALAGMGRYGDVYDLIVSEDENSWYNMVREGGTTCFEAWGKDQKWNTSLCHPWASAPIPVIYEDLMGIRPDGTVGKINMPAKAGKVTVTTPLSGGITVTANKEK